MDKYGVQDYSLKTYNEIKEESLNDKMTCK